MLAAALCRRTFKDDPEFAGGNKITKRYQIGAFGQGGSSTLAFADYVLIVSRCKREPTKCGFTVVRVLKLDVCTKKISTATHTWLQRTANRLSPK